MLSHRLPCEYFSDTPVDFEAFVAREHGLPTEDAARLIRDWMSAYEASGGNRLTHAHDAAMLQASV
jgi:hypothetical protein